jgi:hypothetical protein
MIPVLIYMYKLYVSVYMCTHMYVYMYTFSLLRR